MNIDNQNASFLKELKSQSTWSLFFLSLITLGIYTAYYVKRQSTIINRYIDNNRKIPEGFIHLFYLVSCIAASLLIPALLSKGDELKQIELASEIIDRINVSSEKTGDKVWQLPLWEEYGELIKSDIDDFKNVGGSSAGTITVGYFLKEFAGDLPWVHIDIAETAWSNKDKTYVPRALQGYA